MRTYPNFRFRFGITDIFIIVILTALITFLACYSPSESIDRRNVAITDSIIRDTVYVPKGIYIVTQIKYRKKPQRTTTSTMGNKDADTTSIECITPIVDTLIQGTVKSYICKSNYKIVKQSIRYTFRKASKDSTDVNETPKKPPNTMLAMDTIKNQLIKDRYNDIKCNSREPSVQDGRSVQYYFTRKFESYCTSI